MFLTPKGEPFWGGTYFPPVSKYGRPAFPDILKKVEAVYQTQKNIVTTNTSVLCERLGRMSEGLPGDMLRADALDGVAHKIAELIDPVEGGLGPERMMPGDCRWRWTRRKLARWRPPMFAPDKLVRSLLPIRRLCGPLALACHPQSADEAVCLRLYNHTV
jgi:uncharacterized protein YyaL (SSP411 family)